MMGLKAKRIASDLFIYLLLAVLAAVWLFPLVWMVLRSFDVNTGMTGDIIPKAFTIDAYRDLFPGGPAGDYKNYPYMQWAINTFIVAVVSCIISTVMVLMVSYALSRLRFRMRKNLMNVCLVLGLFPGFMSMIALYFIFRQFGFVGAEASTTSKLIALALAYSLGTGTAYYIVKGFFDTVPTAIDEAARIDGASKNRIFWQMMIPLSKPIIIYTVLTNFISPWCDFILARLFVGTGSSAGWTVAVGIREWIGGTTASLVPTHFTRFCSGGVLISIPIVILFLVMQRFYVEGITGGAAKG